MFSKTTADEAAEHSAPLTIATPPGALAPSALHASATGALGVGVGEEGMDDVPVPPPPQAVSSAARHTKVVYFIIDSRERTRQGRY
jgi:hypothetical protein